MLGGVEAVLGATGLGWREGGKEGRRDRKVLLILPIGLLKVASVESRSR